MINRRKTKVMIIIVRPNNNRPDITGYDIVKNYVYLGSLISNEGDCMDIKRRITATKTATISLARVRKDNGIIKVSKKN